METPSPSSRPPKLLDQVRARLRMRHDSARTEEAYVGRARRYILFHGKRHPTDMGTAEVEAFLTSLAVKGRVAASTQNQAMAALLFLYQHVLDKPLGSDRRAAGEAAEAAAGRALARRGPRRN